MNRVQVSPSLLAAPQDKVRELVKLLDPHVPSFHIDVMDNQFVQNYTLDRFSPPFVYSLKTNAEKHVHLMTEIPVKYYNAYAEAGARLIIFHVEVVKNLWKEARAVRDLGARVGVSLKPATPASSLKDIINEVDYVLVMTVEPGFGGQGFMKEMLPKIREVRALGPDIDVAVDGGINAQTAKQCVQAGANVLVAGTSVFNASDPVKAVKELIA